MSSLSDSNRKGAELALSDLTEIWSVAASAPLTGVLPVIEAIAQRTLGHRLLTVMRFHRDLMELERIYTTRPEIYPVGARKSKRGLPWTERVLVQGEVFLGTVPEDLRWAFDDHEKIASLGLGSVINTPIVISGLCLGTLNLTHEAGWYRPGDERLTRVLAYLAAPVLLGNEK